MQTNCTFSSLRPLSYGYGNIGNMRTYKSRYEAKNIELLMQAIPQAWHQHISLYKTRKGLWFVGIVAPQSNSIWTFLHRFTNQLATRKEIARIQKKRTRASILNAEADALE